MYIYKLPEVQYTSNLRAKMLRDIYPELQIEFGYEDINMVTVVYHIHNRIIYAYTTPTSRRQGYMRNHISSLIERGIVSAHVSVLNKEGQALLLNCGFVPSNFITPLLGNNLWGDEKHMVFVLTSDKQKPNGVFAETSLSWLTETIIIEQFPQSI